jgi:hypothetical protein
VRERAVAVAQERLEARHLVLHDAAVGFGGEPLLDDLEPAGVVLALPERRRGEVPLPRRRLVGLAGLATDREHGRAVLERDGAALRLRVA